MKASKEITQIVEHTLDSLDGIQRAIAPPFLYTRIESALESKSVSVFQRMAIFISKPAVAIASFALLLCINSILILQQEKRSTYTNNYEQLISQEYSITEGAEENLLTLNEEQP